MGLTKVTYAMIDGAMVNVLDYGADPTGTDDSTAAIQAAIDAANGGTVYIPAGTYITSDTLECTTIGASVVGDSAGVSIISATHTTGAAIRFYRRYSNIKNIQIAASGARLSATNQTGFGVQFEAEDVPDNTTIRMQACVCENVVVVDQPGTGVYWVGPADQGSVMQSCFTARNRGHGYAQDRGTLSGRTNLAIASGCMTIDTCLFYNNLGNAAVVGAPSDSLSSPAVRVVFDNCEFGVNASDAAIRYTPTQLYLDGANHEVRACVVNGTTIIGGIYCTGRNMWFRNNRYLDCAFAVNVGYDAKLPTQGINIEGMTCINSTIPDMDPAIIVDAGATNVRVLNWLPSSIDSLITPNVPGTQIDSVPQVIQKVDNQTVNNSTTLVNDDELKYPLQATQSYYFEFVLNYQGNSSADIKFAITVPSGADLRWSPANSIKIDTSDAIVIQEVITTSGTSVSFGSNTTTRRNLVIQGYVDCGSTAGDLQLQWAQDTATVANTVVYGGSSNLKVWTHQA